MPGPVDVHVWWARTQDLTPEHLALLDETERERWARYLRRDDQERFALGSAVVRSLVAELDGTLPRYVALDRACPRCGAQHGPVTTPGRAWRCSIAHSGPFAVAAVVGSAAASGVGVDLETRCPPDWVDLLADVVAPDEPPPADEDAFVTLWVRKEAVVKATGEGLSRPLSSFALVSHDGLPRVSGDLPPLRLTDLDMTPLRATADGATVAGALAVGADEVTVRWRRARL